MRVQSPVLGRGQVLVHASPSTPCCQLCPRAPTPWLPFLSLDPTDKSPCSRQGLDPLRVSPGGCGEGSGVQSQQLGDWGHASPIRRAGAELDSPVLVSDWLLGTSSTQIH